MLTTMKSNNDLIKYYLKKYNNNVHIVQDVLFANHKITISIKSLTKRLPRYVHNIRSRR